MRGHEKVVVCYIGTWAAYRKLDGKYDISDIDPKLCTHIIYSFAGLDNVTYEMKPLDPWLDQFVEEKGGGHGKNETKNAHYFKNYSKKSISFPTMQNSSDWYKKFIDLKRTNPHLTILLAIGGWNEGSEKYSKMAGDAKLRKGFIESALKIIKYLD